MPSTSLSLKLFYSFCLFWGVGGGIVGVDKCSQELPVLLRCLNLLLSPLIDLGFNSLPAHFGQPMIGKHGAYAKHFNMS